MKAWKVLGLCFTVVFGSMTMVGCSSGPSKEEKKLFNEQAEVYNKKIDYLESCLKEENPTTQISLSYPTSFFHLTTEEEETWNGADFGDENKKKLKEGKDIEKDADALSDAAPMNSFSVTEEEMEKVNSVFDELKDKYQDFDFKKAKITLYE